jgi:hypothetical protein
MMTNRVRSKRGKDSAEITIVITREVRTKSRNIELRGVLREESV